MIKGLTTSDLKEVEETFYQSFSVEEAPITYPVIRDLIAEKTDPEALCLGYEIDGQVVSAVAFSPVYFSHSEITAYILAPLATHKMHQKKGLATQLINAAKAHLKDNGVGVLLVYGDPEYYGRYGFCADLGKRFIPPYPLEFAFGWQALNLNDEELSPGPHEFTCVNALSDPNLW